MWKEIDSQGVSFWSEMKQTKFARELYRICKCEVTFISKQIVFCSTPSLHPNCLSGKILWLYNFLENKEARNYVFTPRKALCADQNHILIDDSSDNIQEFKQAGGKAILYPQPWNLNYKYAKDAIGYTQGALHALIDS